MRYVIKLILERDNEVEKEWAIGSLVRLDPTEKELAFIRRELFKVAKAHIELLLEEE